MASIAISLIIRAEIRKQFGRYQVIRRTNMIENGRILRRWWIIAPVKGK
jgi:hypothetical protein